jgi:hypothetical protein
MFHELRFERPDRSNKVLIPFAADVPRSGRGNRRDFYGACPFELRFAVHPDVFAGNLGPVRNYTMEGQPARFPVDIVDEAEHNLPGTRAAFEFI